MEKQFVVAYGRILKTPHGSVGIEVALDEKCAGCGRGIGRGDDYVRISAYEKSVAIFCVSECGGDLVKNLREIAERHGLPEHEVRP